MQFDKLQNQKNKLEEYYKWLVDGFLKSIAESIVMGKELNTTFKDLAQQILVNIIAKTLIKIRY